MIIHSPMDPNDLNPGIREVVAWLRERHFLTTDSGDGVTNVQAGMEGALDCPHVHCVVRSDLLTSEADRLFDLLVHEGLDPAQNVPLPGFEEQVGPAWSVEATYCPGDLGDPDGPLAHQTIGIVSLFGVDDQKLAAAQAAQGAR